MKYKNIFPWLTPYAVFFIQHEIKEINKLVLKTDIRNCVYDKKRSDQKKLSSFLHSILYKTHKDKYKECMIKDKSPFGFFEYRKSIIENILYQNELYIQKQLKEFYEN